MKSLLLRDDKHTSDGSHGMKKIPWLRQIEDFSVSGVDGSLNDTLYHVICLWRFYDVYPRVGWLQIDSYIELNWAKTIYIDRERSLSYCDQKWQVIILFDKTSKCNNFFLDLFPLSIIFSVYCASKALVSCILFNVLFIVSHLLWQRASDFTVYLKVRPI